MIRNVYYDDDGNELLFHINKDEKLYLELGQSGTEPRMYIVLDREDLQFLIDELNNCLVQMKNPF